MNKEQLYEFLIKLLPAQFEEVLFRLDIPRQYLSSGTPQAMRSLETLQYLGSVGRLDELKILMQKRTGRQSTKEEELTELLIDLFSPEELRRFVRFGPDGSGLVSSLPDESASLLVLATQIVDLFRRHGLIETSFFDRLVDARPLRSHLIRKVERVWIQEPERAASGDEAVRTHPSQPNSGAQEGRRPARVFISYSHRDRSFVEELSAHIRVLQRQGIVEVWSDSEITAGQNWREKVEREMARAEVILLMISSNYLASDFCWSIELQHALRRHQERAAVVVPVLLRPCDWKDTPFAMLKALPDDGTPISMYRDTDLAWTEVAAGIRRVVMANNQSDNRKHS